MSEALDLDAITQQFHETYERLAPEYSYETRKTSAVPWDQVPDNNRRLMLAVVREVVGPICAEVERLRRDLQRIDFEDRQFREKASRLGSPSPPAILGQIARNALNPTNKDS